MELGFKGRNKKAERVSVHVFGYRRMGRSQQPIQSGPEWFAGTPSVCQVETV